MGAMRWILRAQFVFRFASSFPKMGCVLNSGLRYIRCPPFLFMIPLTVTGRSRGINLNNTPPARAQLSCFS